MCGRYVLDLAGDHPQYLAGFELTQAISSFNVAPSHPVPILVDHLEGSADRPFRRELHTARWGLLPAWAKDPSFSSRTFNARSESIFEKASFRQAALRGHCALPVSGYYEWKTETTAAGRQVKTPYYIHRRDGRPIYLAGLYDWWKIQPEAAGPGGPFAGQAGQWLLSCSIITMESPGPGEPEPRQQLGQLHQRIPLPLQVADDRQISSADSLTGWLRSGWPAGAGTLNPRDLSFYRQQAQESLEQLCQQAYEQLDHWQLRPVSPAVGKVSNNSPQLLEPPEDLLSGL